MRLQLIVLALFASVLVTGANKDKERQKRLGDATYSNDNIDIAATVLLAHDDLHNEQGGHLGPC